MAGMRTVKAPDERRRELLDTAMRLFVERGFSATSMRDIANAAHVTPGLAYHYFDSKQTLFAEVLDSYAHRCVETGISALDALDLTFDQKLDALLDALAQEERMPYHEFFHKAGNRAFHDELSVRMCDLLVPHLTCALEREAQLHNAQLDAPQTLADFIAHGLINLLSDPDVPDADVLARVRGYVQALVSSQMHVGSGAVPGELPAAGEEPRD